MERCECVQRRRSANEGGTEGVGGVCVCGVFGAGHLVLDRSVRAEPRVDDALHRSMDMEDIARRCPRIVARAHGRHFPGLGLALLLHYRVGVGSA